MRLFTVPLLLATVLLLPRLAAAESGDRSFVERVRPDDYFAVEKLFEEAYSRTEDLVILRTTNATPTSVLSLKPASGGEGYTLTIHLASAEAPGGWLKISEELDTALGQQVLRAVELRLHRQVTLSKLKRTVSKADTDLWLYQRLADDTIAAAVITMEGTLNNPTASTFIDDFLGSLQQLVGKEGVERAALLQKIDRIATEIILVESR